MRFSDGVFDTFVTLCVAITHQTLYWCQFHDTAYSISVPVRARSPVPNAGSSRDSFWRWSLHILLFNVYRAKAAGTWHCAKCKDVYNCTSVSHKPFTALCYTKK